MGTEGIVIPLTRSSIVQYTTDSIKRRIPTAFFILLSNPSLTLQIESNNRIPNFEFNIIDNHQILQIQMLPIEQCSRVEEPSAQILDRIEIDVGGENKQQKHQEFNPEVVMAEKCLEQITGDFGKSTGLFVLYMVFGMVFLFSCLLGFQTVMYGSEYVENGTTDVLFCQNPTEFNLDNEIKCIPFDLETNPKIGVIAKVNPENQYLYTRLIVTRPTRKYEIANIFARLSVYSLQQSDDKRVRYVKKDAIVENQKISLEVSTQTVSHPYYSSNKYGFIAPIKLIRPITEEAYLIVLKFDSLQMGYLETSTNIQLTTEYVPEQTFFMIIAVRLVCIAIIAISCFVFRCSINSQEPEQLQIQDSTKYQQKVLLYFGLLQGICLDPFLAITMTKPNIFSDILSSLFLTIQLASFILLTFYLLDFYINKQFLTRKHLVIPAIIVVGMMGVYSFCTTFLEWRSIIPIGDEVARFILLIVSIPPLLYPITKGLNILLSHKEFETRHLGFYFFSSCMLLVLAGCIARYEYRVYAIEMSSIVVPMMIAGYVFCIQFFFKVKFLSTADGEENLEQNQELAGSPSEINNIQNPNNQPKLQNKQDMDYFEIQQKTEQFQQRSENI